MIKWVLIFFQNGLLEMFMVFVYTVYTVLILKPSICTDLWSITPLIPMDIYTLYLFALSLIVCCCFSAGSHLWSPERRRETTKVSLTYLLASQPISSHSLLKGKGFFKACVFSLCVCVCSYDDILVNGLPDWRQPVFYYRRVRKMSNTELAFLLFLILTVGHYAIIWSIYLEKQLVR